ncbi:DUF4129 domain-containing protein [Natrinema salaciae]|uniref:Protein-glutamine gamma-glutamyltransferase-like C-terminal domain-containing protein n=1 Tax=Natrinema salaciae TaxID=1186196 RepID=A0A1H9Q2H6_9EURY|nr:DUF4129 domain-containing protein [Natrinema salaciae]SER54661.1 protein of unknown function [Natrinema salaciae]
MTGGRRLLFVVGCLCCLFVVASALPAADPRLDGPGQSDGEPIAGDWDSIDGTPEIVTDPSDVANETDDVDDGDTDTEEITIDGALEPGNVVTVDIGLSGMYSAETIAVNGENVTEASVLGESNITVPYAEAMTVSVPADGRSRTFDIRTDATIETHGEVAPNRDLEIAAAVGSTPVPGATVTLDGEAVATTDEDGEATVTMPETARSVELHVERDPVTGERTVDVGEPTVTFVSPLLFPGGPAPVQVSADGDPVPNATVTLEDGGTSSTGDDGMARLWLPIDDEATVTVEVGAETATATVGNLYLRLTAVVVFVPGFAIGGVLTYLRVAAARERRRGIQWSGSFVALADFVAGLADAFEWLFGALVGWGGPSLSIPTIPLPTFSLPRPAFDGVGLGAPSLGSALSFGGLPSLGSRDRPSTGGGGSLLERLLGTDDEPETPPAEETGPELADEPLAPRGPHAEIRAAWHAFLDRLGLEDRETATPGEAARTALAAGLPADRVTRLVAIVRDVEYGGREPTPDRVAEARATVRELLDRDDDEEGST